MKKYLVKFVVSDGNDNYGIFDKKFYSFFAISDNRMITLDLIKENGDQYYKEQYANDDKYFIKKIEYIKDVTHLENDVIELLKY